MRVGEVIAALCLLAQDNYTLMANCVDEIDVRDDYIEIYFTDYNTTNLKIYKDGNYVYL